MRSADILVLIALRDYLEEMTTYLASHNIELSTRAKTAQLALADVLQNVMEDKNAQRS